MSTPEMSTVVSSDARRFTIVNLKQVNELPLRNALQSFDKNGDGKIDISELQKIIYWYGLWKYVSFGLCLIIMTLVWSTFGLTIWAINLTKDYTVTNGVLTGNDEVVKMSVASTHIPLSWASLLDRRHLDALEGLSIDVTQGSGKFSSGVYHMKVASYLHANSTYLKLFGQDGSRVWVNSGTVVLHHPDADEAIMVCGAAACNTMAVDVKPEYLKQLVQRSVSLLVSSQDFELPSEVDGVAINKAAGENSICKASYKRPYRLTRYVVWGLGGNIGIRHIEDELLKELNMGKWSEGDVSVLLTREAPSHTGPVSAFGVNDVKYLDAFSLQGEKKYRVRDVLDYAHVKDDSQLYQVYPADVDGESFINGETPVIRKKAIMTALEASAAKTYDAPDLRLVDFGIADYVNMDNAAEIERYIHNHAALQNNDMTN